MEPAVQRAFVAVWVVLGVAGALNHTIAEKVVGERFDLVLPHLKYGYVMFNVNPHAVQVFEYARADGVHHELAELVPTPAPGYERTRLAIDVATKPEYLNEVCYRATRAHHEEYDFFVSEYDVDVDPRSPSRSLALHCDTHGLAPR